MLNPSPFVASSVPGLRGMESPIEGSPAADGGYAVVALASSAGGLQALIAVFGGLPAHFPVPIVVVQHLSRTHQSQIAEILGQQTKLKVKLAEEGDRLRPGTVWIAPPDFHLLVKLDGTLALNHSPPVLYVRPSADLLFASVAACFKARAIGIVLSGTGNDGAKGVRAIKQMGGTVLVQDEASAEFSGMPGAAIRTGIVDSVLPLGAIATALRALVMPGGVG